MNVDTVEIRPGVHMPRFGLGVFRAGSETQGAVSTALEVGYRHIDTAAIYKNEKDVGRAIAASGVPREEIFVTTKLWNADHGEDKAHAACLKSLDRLQMEYVDLYLIHWPVSQLRLASWRAMEKLLEEGRCRAIGVSNFMERHLDELIAHSNVKPAVNQFELHTFLQQKPLVAHCNEIGVTVESYSPLAKAKHLDHPALEGIAAAVGKTPALVMIRWCYQKGFVVIPKSSRPERIRENATILDFELGPDHMAAIDAIDENLRTAWDPTTVA